jgi:hypothetical protein
LLYLVHIPDASEPDLAGFGDSFELHRGLHLIDSDLSRSRLYHEVKWQLPEGTALLVAPLADRPKFKGMAPGATAWLRARSR